MQIIVTFKKNFCFIRGMHDFVPRVVSGKKLTIEDIKYTSKRVISGGEIVGRFIADVNKRVLYAIPRDIDHPDFVALVEGKRLEELKANPLMYNRYGSVSIVCTEDVIESILIGIAGFEVVMMSAYRKMNNVTGKMMYHTQEQLNTALNIAFEYIIDGALPLKEGYKQILVRGK